MIDMHQFTNSKIKPITSKKSCIIMYSIGVDIIEMTRQKMMTQ